MSDAEAIFRRVTPTQDGRPKMRTRAEVIAWRCSLRIAAIPEISDRLNGSALDEVKQAIEAELDLAFKMGGEPSASEEATV
jgi:hypothetical protein